MAKRPTRRRRRSDPGPVNALGWRRLLGSNRNYRNVSDPRQPIGTTISERQMAKPFSRGALRPKDQQGSLQDKGRKRRIVVCQCCDTIATDQCQK
jgi:hypothetical protein